MHHVCIGLNPRNRNGLTIASCPRLSTLTGYIISWKIMNKFIYLFIYLILNQKLVVIINWQTWSPYFGKRSVKFVQPWSATSIATPQAFFFKGTDRHFCLDTSNVQFALFSFPMTTHGSSLETVPKDLTVGDISTERCLWKLQYSMLKLWSDVDCW